MMYRRHYLKLVSCLIVFALFITMYSTAWAGNCLDTWSGNNSRNLLGNSGFEMDSHSDKWINPDDTSNYPNDPPSITTAIDTANAHTGTQSVKVAWDDGSLDQYFHFFQDIPVTQNRTYRLTGFIKTDNITCDICDATYQKEWNGARISAIDYPHNPNWQSVTNSVYGYSGWTMVSAEFKIPAGSDQMRITLKRLVNSTNSGPSYGTAWWDDIQFMPVPIITGLSAGSAIIITGEGFGADPGAGSRSSDENCVLHGGACLPDSSVTSWSDTVIEITPAGDETISVRSGGIVSNAMVLTPVLSLTNGTLSIDLPDIINGYGIAQITDTATGREFIDASSGVQPLYELTVKDSPLTDAKTTLTSRDAAFISRTYAEEGGLKTVTITANHCNEFTVTATITLPSVEGAAKFTIDVQNTGDRVLQSVRYPLIAAASSLGSSPADDAIILPVFVGSLLKNPNAGPSNNYFYKDIDYPGLMSMQMTAYYDTEQPAGLYMAMDDGEGHKKKFGFERVNEVDEDYILFSFLHVTSEDPAPGSATGGNDISLTYNVIVDTFAGDWYDAADKYREWALTQSWMSTTLADRTDVPDWLYEIKTKVNCFHCVHEDYAAIAEHYEDLLDVSNVLVFPGGYWSYNAGLKKGTEVWWTGNDYFSDDPVYGANEPDPQLAVFPKLENAISDLDGIGSEVLLFISTFYWDQYYYKLGANPEDPGDARFESCTILDPLTSIPDALKIIDDRYDYYDQDRYTYVKTTEAQAPDYLVNFAAETTDTYCRITSMMCIGDPVNNIVDELIYNNIKRGIDHGARIMSLDGVVGGKIRGCWDPSHGHPLGEGRWTHDRFKETLGHINNVILPGKNASGNFALGMEEPHELYLQDLQFQYVRHSSLKSWVKGNKRIPLFNFVYKNYYLGIEMGAWFGVNNTINRWGLGMDFVQGNIQGTGIDSQPDDEPNWLLNNYYKRLIQMKRPDFYKGSMLRPPVFTGMPLETTLENDGRVYYIDPVVTNVLKTDNRTISYLLVNTNTDGSGVSNIRFDAAPYDLPSNRVSIKTIKNSSLILHEMDVYLSHPVNISLDGGDVVEVRVEVDSDGDGMPDAFEERYSLDPGDPFDAGDDSDADGLSNLLESELETDPTGPDTDNDGLTDLNEYQSATDATNPDTDHDRIPDNEDNCPLTKPITISGTSLYTAILQDAYAYASDAETILYHAGPLNQDIHFNQNKNITLDGGYSCNYTARTGVTTVNGDMTVIDGTVTIGNFVLQ